MTRARYLFDFAHFAATPAPLSLEMTVADFAILVIGVDAYRDAMAKGS